MRRVITYDLARLFIGPIFPTPRGIDRVDLAVARHVFADPATGNLGILPTPWGVRAYPADVVRRMLAKLENLWAEDLADCNDPKLRWLVGHIHTSDHYAAAEIPQPEALSLRAKVWRIFQELRATGLPLGAPARRAVPHGSVYINIGQLGLAIPLFHNWLEDRSDITCAIMLHDVIPLEFPHLVSTGAVAHHARMVRTSAQHANCLIFNSEFACESVHAVLARHGQERLPSLVRSLPLAPAFFAVEESLPELAGVNYFAIVSTIEPRKNHELLFKAWLRLTARLGEAAPHLVVIGAMGYGSQQILAGFDFDHTLRARVHFVSGLSSRALASLLLGATGMLCPSITEGFGLPLQEANALGVPVIASDIPAHREIGAASTIFMATDDVTGWERAIGGMPTPGQRARPPVPDSLTEAAYASEIVQFVSEVGTRTGRRET